MKNQSITRKKIFSKGKLFSKCFFICFCFNFNDRNLIRKYSQINKITIEELKQNDSNSSNETQEESNAYLVEFEEEKVLEEKNSLKFDFNLNQNEQIPFKSSANKTNLHITELDENDNSVLSRFNKTNLNLLEVEAMDI